jgi:magnesium transporter
VDENLAVVSGLSDTVDTLASHKINEVVRLLTIVTFLTLPLTLLATVFGMNILLPLEKHPLLFYFILVIGFFITIGVIYYLRKRKLL